MLPNITGLAGGYAGTDSQGTALGFVGPLSPYSGASVVNGVFSGPGGFSFPLAPGGAVLSASGAGTTSPLGPVTESRLSRRMIPTSSPNSYRSTTPASVR